MVSACTFTESDPGVYVCTACGRRVRSPTPQIEAACVASVRRPYLPRPLLGDALAAILTAVGITEARVTAWLGGRECGCASRRRWLNRWGVLAVDRVERWLTRLSRFALGD